jgi:hypothetical protein
MEKLTNFISIPDFRIVGEKMPKESSLLEKFTFAKRQLKNKRKTVKFFKDDVGLLVTTHTTFKHTEGRHLIGLMSIDARLNSKKNDK